MKFLSKRVFLGLTLVLLLWIAIFYLLLLDDALSKESLELLEADKPASSQEGYFYLMGIQASADEDPIAVGKNLLASIQQQAKIPKANPFVTTKYQLYPDDKKLVLPTGYLFCHLKEEKCFEKIIDNLNSFNPNDYSVLLQRYLTYIQMPKHDLLTTADADEPFPPYHYLVKGSRVFLLTLIQQEQFNPGSLIEQLNNHLVLLRAKLATANNLIEKMVYTSMISQHIDFMLYISALDNYKNATKLEKLSISEMNFSPALKREFWWQSSLFKKLHGSPYLFGEEGSTPTFIARILFKQNMSINLAATEFSRIINTSRLSAFEFAQYKSAPTKFENNYSLRNIIGNKLVAIARPDYDKYVLRVHELNNKILLFNSLVANKGELVDLVNPYYQLSEQPEIKNGRLCLKSPMDDDSLTGCLVVINEQPH